MLIDTASVLQINHSKSNNNNGESEYGAFCIFNNSLFVAMDSSFTENTGILGSIHMLGSTGYLEKCNLMGNYGKIMGGIVISNVDLKLSKTVFVHSMIQYTADMEILKANERKFGDKLYTYQCEFKNHNKTLTSNVTNFKQIAIKEHFLYEINPYNRSIIDVEETQFASSKSIH